MHTSRVNGFLVLASALAFFGCGQPIDHHESAVSSGLGVSEVDCGGMTPDLRVDVEDGAFEPNDARIPDGGVVMWTNRGRAEHTVTSGRPEDEDAGERFHGEMHEGESYCLQFEGRGSALYFCEYHPMSMRDATVTVGED